MLKKTFGTMRSQQLRVLVRGFLFPVWSHHWYLSFPFRSARVVNTAPKTPSPPRRATLSRRAPPRPTVPNNKKRNRRPWKYSATPGVRPSTWADGADIISSKVMDRGDAGVSPWATRTWLIQSPRESSRGGPEWRRLLDGRGEKCLAMSGLDR